MALVTSQTQADVERLTKIIYKSFVNNTYASYDSILSQFSNEVGTYGKQIERAFQTSLGGFGGGYANSVIPKSNQASTVKATYQAKRHFAPMSIDRYALKNAKDEGAMVNLLKWEIQNKIIGFNVNRARNFFNDGTGVLAQFLDTEVSGTASAPIITFGANTKSTSRYGLRFHHLESKTYIQVGSTGNATIAASSDTSAFVAPDYSSRFEIVSFDQDTRVLTLSRVEGSQDLTGLGAGAYNIIVQDSFSSDRTGIFNVLFDTSVYGQTMGRRWEPHGIPGLANSDVNGANISIDMLTEVADGYNSDSEQTFTNIVLPPVQWRKLKMLMESSKRHIAEAKMMAKAGGVGDKNVVASIGYNAIRFHGVDSTINLTQHRLLRDDMVLFLNSKAIYTREVEAPQWDTEDGSMWDRSQTKDEISARYVCYGENMINPYHVGFIQGLSTSNGIVT